MLAVGIISLVIFLFYTRHHGSPLEALCHFVFSKTQARILISREEGLRVSEMRSLSPGPLGYLGPEQEPVCGA